VAKQGGLGRPDALHEPADRSGVDAERRLTRTAVEAHLPALLDSYEQQPELVQRALLLLASAFPDSVEDHPALLGQLPASLRTAWDELMSADGNPTTVADGQDTGEAQDRQEELEQWALAGWHEPGDQVPRHVGYVPGRAFGSVLQGCSAYRADDHWHYVTYGLSNLFDEDEGDNDGLSGWGYELTWRVRDQTSDQEAPGWPFTILQRLAKWAAEAPVLLEENTRLVINAPVTGYPHSGGPDTDLTGVLLATDPQLGQITTGNGRVRFLQFVAVNPSDLALAQEQGSAVVLDRLRQADPLLVSVVGP